MSTKPYYLLLVLLFPLSAFAQDLIMLEMNFFGGITRHHALLVMTDEALGLIRVKYYDSDCKCQQMVQQAVKLEKTDNGMTRMACFSPTYVRTGKAASYSPDNFYMYQDTDGTFVLYNIDAQGVKSEVTYQDVSGDAAMAQKLKEFQWDELLPGQEKSFFFKNDSGQALNFQLSTDGQNWDTYSLTSGYSQKFGLSSSGSFSYARIYTDDTPVAYKIYPDKRYILDWNESKGRWDIYEE